jgi:nitric oxide reductase large subunit
MAVSPLIMPDNRQFADFKANRYDESSGVLAFSRARIDVFNQLVGHYGEFFATPDTRNGLRPLLTLSKSGRLTRLFQLVCVGCFRITAGTQLFLPNNWPPKPLVGNHAIADTLERAFPDRARGTGLLLAAFLHDSELTNSPFLRILSRSLASLIHPQAIEERHRS